MEVPCCFMHFCPRQSRGFPVTFVPGVSLQVGFVNCFISGPTLFLTIIGIYTALEFLADLLKKQSDLGWGFSSVVKHLPSKRTTLTSIPGSLPPQKSKVVTDIHI